MRHGRTGSAWTRIGPRRSDCPVCGGVAARHRQVAGAFGEASRLGRVKISSLTFLRTDRHRVLRTRDSRTRMSIFLSSVSDSCTPVVGVVWVESDSRPGHAQRGSAGFVASLTAPIACRPERSSRVGLAPTGTRRLITAHTLSRLSCFEKADLHGFRATTQKTGECVRADGVKPRLPHRSVGSLTRDLLRRFCACQASISCASRFSSVGLSTPAISDAQATTCIRSLAKSTSWKRSKIR